MDLMARRRAIMGMPSGKDYTVSGNVVSISNALAKNAKSVIVTFLPKQSGSGDPSPDNVRPITGYNDISAVRYGKNLWSMTACVGCAYNPTVGTVFDTTPATLQPTDNGDGSFSITISSWQYVCFIVPVPSDESMRLSFSRSGTGGRRTFGWLDADKKVLAKYNNTDANETYSSTWMATDEVKYLFFVFTSNTASTQTITYPQVEIGYTATSYEPYISPVTANVHVGGAGANKWDEQIELGTISTSTGESVLSYTQLRTVNYVPVVAGQTYRMVTRAGAANGVWTFFYDSNKTLITSGLPSGSGSSNNARRFDNGTTITIPAGCAYLRWYFQVGYGTTYNNDTALNYPSSVTAYEPYSLFGGTVDLVSGECVVDRVFETITGNSNWYSFSTGTGNSSAVVQLNHWDNVKYTSGNASYNGAIGSSGREAQNYWTSARQNEVPNEGDMAFAYSYTGQLRVHRTDVANITDLASFKSAFVGLQICYPLATPITYHLTPSQLALLKGNNTVYSNEGSISLTYVGK